MININRPICFLDIESTGLDRNTDRIIELSIIKLLPNGSREAKTKRFNPGIPIPPTATECHGIKDEDVKDCPEFRQLAKGILEFISDCDLAGFNSSAYDIPLLFNEFQRAGMYMPYENVSMIDVGNIFKIREPRTLEAAVKFYCNTTLENAHSAEADVNATIDVFLKQMEKYEDLPKTVKELDKYSNYDRELVDISGNFSKDAEGNIILNFGKYRGKKSLDHTDFLEWMLYKANFSMDTNKVVKGLLEEHYKQPFI